MSKFPTPQYKIESEEENVYPPSEDTFLLIDALEKERESLIAMNPSLSLEIGSGSGVVTTFLHQLLMQNSGDNQPTTSTSSRLFSICTDLNGHALYCTKRTAHMNLLGAEVLDLVHCNILDPLLSRIAKCSVDILLMNPPYVPTEENAKEEKELFYSGGPQGRHLLDKLLPNVAQLLSPKGVFFLVALRENGVNELLSPEENKKYGLETSVVLERKCRNEHLYVLKFTKNSIVGTEKRSSPAQVHSASNPTKSPSVGTKITLHLKPVGAAPQLKKEFTKYKVDPNWTIFQLQQTLRKILAMKPSDSLFLFVNEAFAPSPEQTIGNLHQCFGSDSGILYFQYSLTPAWG